MMGGHRADPGPPPGRDVVISAISRHFCSDFEFNGANGVVGGGARIGQNGGSGNHEREVG